MTKLLDMEAQEYIQYKEFPGAQIDKRLKPIMDKVVAEAHGTAEQQKEFKALQERIQQSIEKVDTVYEYGDKNKPHTGPHGLQIIAVPPTVGNSMVTPGLNPKHWGEQILYFHVDEKDVTKGIVYPDGRNVPIPPEVMMKHELGHVAQNRGGYDTPLSATSDAKIKNDKDSREQDAYNLEISGGKIYRNSYGDGKTKFEFNGHVVDDFKGSRKSPDNPFMNAPSNTWERNFEWPSQDPNLIKKYGPQSEADHMQGLAAVSRQINAADNGFTEEQKAALNSMVAKNAEAAGITIQDTQKREVQQDAGRSLGMG